ncbi:MAG: VOC family protein [Chitinophagaceae bacterium]
MTATSIIPCIGYKDAATAIEWLCNAFGFEKHLIVQGDNGIVAHAELKLGNVMIMTGSQKHDSAYSKLTKHPSDVGNFVTQSPYIVLDDKDIVTHYETAKNYGAEIILELKSEDYGGKNYSCYDIEGHLWNFGSYDPWKSEIT